MAIAFDAAAGSYTTGTSLTIGHTIGSGSNRVVIVGVSNEFGSITGVTYNGVSMTLAVQETTGGRISQLYYLLEANLPAAGTYNAVITIGSAGNGTVGVVSSYSGVKQQGPESTNTAYDDGGGTTISTNIVTNSANDLIVDMLYDSESNSHTATASGQTARYDSYVSGGSAAGSFSDRFPTTAGTYAMSWTANGAAGFHHSLAAFAPDDAPGGGSSGTGSMSMKSRYWGDL